MASPYDPPFTHGLLPPIPFGPHIAFQLENDNLPLSPPQAQVNPSNSSLNMGIVVAHPDSPHQSPPPPNKPNLTQVFNGPHLEAHLSSTSQDPPSLSLVPPSPKKINWALL
ncbi:hypothetical protein AXF42_Ash015650 [Apostasia shenzhenica]|uniref:Uncharacterized protein n=1 Tax=Apostasia shenzhenica TaxID=1088818 RepID=A0A2H9ZTZ0_9ASPA|nr:hypothetical protein AXF42_Ash015650 [Apostasia shenzhenica]